MPIYLESEPFEVLISSEGSWWGPWFPQPAAQSFGSGTMGRVSWWGGINAAWFPEGLLTTIPPVEPIGAASFLLTLESTAKLSQRWITGLGKFYSGREKRSSSSSDPGFVLEGEVKLMGPSTRAVRARLARNAAAGAPFWIGLPHEEITVRANSVGTVIPVFSTALSDWAVPGCPVFVIHNFYGGTQVTIQSVTADSITVDVAPGNMGKKGARVIPAISVLLDPRQGFDRYPKQVPDPVEVWKIKARNINPGFMSSPVPAFMKLEDPQTHSGVLDGLRIVARDGGAGGNDIVITQSDDALTDQGEFEEDPVLKTIHIKYAGDSTTVADYVALFLTMELVRIEGTYNGTDILASADDEFAATNLSGGANAGVVEVGKGATITEFAGRPVWDRGITVKGSVMDSLQAKAQPQDLGGRPFVTGIIAKPDWGRGIAVTGELGEPLQWFKRFCDTVKGSWRGFWLTTAREDLLPVSTAAGTLTVQGGEAAGDFFAWYPSLLQYLEIVQEDGVTMRVRIDDAVDNGDDTLTLDIVDEDDNPVTLSAEPIEGISWLELVRLEHDNVDTVFRGAIFSSQLDARVIQNYAYTYTATGDLFVKDEASIEDSEPREGIEFFLPNSVWRISTSSRDEDFNGATFHAQPGARGDVKVIPMGSDTSNSDTTEIHIPMAHYVAQRWMAGLVPPRRLTVNIWRKQLNSGTEEIIWAGEVVSMSPEGEIAKFNVPSRLSRAMARGLPTLTAGRSCPHVLGDASCTKDVEAMKVSAVVLSKNGRIVTVSSIGGKPNGWAEGGRLRHVASLESMTVYLQTGTVVEMQLPIWELNVGDAVEILPGCGKLVSICRDKFDNVVNFGNPPALPLVNPMRTTGFGVISSS